MSGYGIQAQSWSQPFPMVGPSVHLTRRGRLLRSLGAVLLTCGLGATAGHRLLGEEVSATTQQPTQPQTVEVVVQAGDSLWSIAERVAPERDPREVVTAVRELNGLRSNLIQPGQVVLLPHIR